MVRLVASLALVLGAIVLPMEQPSAHAERWVKVKATEECVDVDSIRRGADGEVSWTAKSCGDSDSIRMKTNYWHQASIGGDHNKVVVFFYNEDSKSWVPEKFPTTSVGFSMYAAVCYGELH